MQPVSPTVGESGYFSAPVDTLDPHLFEGTTIKQGVRDWILQTLYGFWNTRYNSPRSWSRVWIAGSGISYQWAASRGNGDLDILIGVDWDQFYQKNPQYVGFNEADMATMINAESVRNLWPSTANKNIGGQTYEVTWYVNPNSTDIRDINPYAAYDLTRDEWTVKPPTGSAFVHPEGYYKAAEDEATQARSLIDRYNTYANQAGSLQPGSPGWLNATSQADLTASQASTLYDSIHLGRKQAFAPGGSGYGDYYNFRWQYHKQQGTAQALHAVGASLKASQEAYAEQVYGHPIDSANLSLRRAVMSGRR